MAKEYNKTLKDYAEYFLDWSEYNQRKNTYIANCQAFKKFIDFIKYTSDDYENFKLIDIRSKLIDDFRTFYRKKSLKASSVNAHFRQLKAAMSKAVIHENIPKNPFLNIPQLKIDRKEPLFIPLEDIGDFLNSIKNLNTRLLIKGYLSTGRRRCELLYLKWSDINFKTKKYKAVNSKGHMTQEFPINYEFMDVLEQLKINNRTNNERLFYQWITPNSVTAIVKRELILAGYQKFKLHNLRHSFAAAHLRSGGTLFTLQKLLGHSDIKTTMIYSHLTDDHLSEANNKLKF